METTRVSRTVQTPTWLSAKLIENIIPHTCYVLRVFPSDQQTSILNFVNKQVILEKFNSSEEIIFLLLKIFYDFGKNSRVLSTVLDHSCMYCLFTFSEICEIIVHWCDKLWKFCTFTVKSYLCWRPRLAKFLCSFRIKSHLGKNQFSFKVGRVCIPRDIYTAIEDWNRKWLRTMRNRSKKGAHPKLVAVAYSVRLRALILLVRIEMASIKRIWSRPDWLSRA